MLDRDTLKGLRESTEYVTFRARWDHGEPTESKIVGKCRDAAGESYARVVYELPSFLEYGSALTRQHRILNAYSGVSSPRFHDTWRTVLAMLRTGDECKLVWSANGHANTYVHDAGLNVDTLELEVARNNRRLRFHIATSVCPSNTARMFTAGDNQFGAVYGPNPTLLAAHGPHADDFKHTNERKG